MQRPSNLQKLDINLINTEQWEDSETSGDSETSDDSGINSENSDSENSESIKQSNLIKQRELILEKERATYELFKEQTLIRATNKDFICANNLYNNYFKWCNKNNLRSDDYTSFLLKMNNYCFKKTGAYKINGVLYCWYGYKYQNNSLFIFIIYIILIVCILLICCFSKLINYLY
jgi:hypothetical protein